MLPSVLAALGGILYPLAFSPFDLPALAPVAIGLLFMAWRSSTPGRAAWQGFLFGLGQYGFGVSWIFVSMHDYGGASVYEATGLTALFTVCMALYPALAGWLAVRFFQGSRVFRLILVYPAIWMAVEWLRGWFLTGFTWLQVGYSQTDTLLAGYAPVLGSYGVGWLTVMLAGMVLVLLHGRRRTRRFVAAGVLLIVGGGLLLKPVNWSEPAGESFRVTLLQGNIPQDAKWQPAFQRQTLLHYADMTRQHWDSRLVVWPETAIPALYHQVRDSFLPGLQTEARQHGTDLLIGVPYLDETTHQYYNALLGLGEKTGFYFKRHLVPFGEYLPLRPLFGFILDILEIPLSDFAAGTAAQPALQAAGHPLAASICYEDIFGQESLQGLPDARYLVNVTNDAWFGHSMAPYQHVQMARMRALETARYLLRATNTGVSALIAPDGRILNQAPLFETSDVTGSIQPLQGITPYIRWGDSAFVVLLAGALGWARWQSRTQPRKEEDVHDPY